jgi:hypothetical protein
LPKITPSCLCTSYLCNLNNRPTMNWINTMVSWIRFSWVCGPSDCSASDNYPAFETKLSASNWVPVRFFCLGEDAHHTNRWQYIILYYYCILNFLLFYSVAIPCDWLITVCYQSINPWIPYYILSWSFWKLFIYFLGSTASIPTQCCTSSFTCWVGAVSKFTFSLFHE